MQYSSTRSDAQCREENYLLVNKNPEPRLAFDDGIGHTHLATQRRQEYHQFDGIHVVRNEDQIRLPLLDQGNDVIQAEFDRVRLFADIFLFLAFPDRGRFFQQALFLFSLGFRLVFGKEFEGLRCRIAVEGIGCCELGNRRGDFETEVEDFALAL